MNTNEKWKWQVVLALYALVALLWTGRCVSTLHLYGQMDFLHFLCAVAWIVLFFIQLQRYRRKMSRED